MSAVPYLTDPQFKAWMLHMHGLGPRPAYPKNLIVPKYQAVFDENQRFRVWTLWLKAGKPNPRPSILWRNKAGTATSPGWAGWLRGLLEAPSPHPAPQPGPPPSEQFHLIPSKTTGRSGLYFYDYPNHNIDESRLIQLCQQRNLWIALLAHELNRAPQPDFGADETRKRFQAQGVTVVATGWLDANYDLDPQADAAHRFSQGYDEYMGNMEASWKFDANPAGFQRMGEMAPKLRAALGPSMPLSVSCEWGQVSWWRPLLQMGLSAVRPQCYMDEWPHMSPREAIIRARWAQGDLPSGLPVSVKVEPTYGQQRSSSPPLSTWAAYDDEIGRPAKSVWNARHCLEADVVWVTRR